MTQPVDDAARRRRHRNERIVAVAGVSLLIAALIAFIRWNANEEERFHREKTYIPPKVAMTPAIRALQEYVRIDTSNPPGNEIAGAKFLANVLARNGIRSEIIESAPGRASLYARIRGRRPGEGLLLLSHIDVMPADPKMWKRPPFSADIELATLYGRGAIDMKSIAICQLAAFIGVARSGRQPERDIVFLAVADEETGGALGMRWLVEHRPDLLDGIRYAIGEGGITEMIADRPTYFAIEIGAKQYVRLLFEADSMEPLLKLRRAMEPDFGGWEPERILPEVRKYFRELAPSRRMIREELSDIDTTIAHGRFWRLLKPYRDLTQNNVWIHWPQNDDHGASARGYMLLLPDEDPLVRIAWVRRKAEALGIRTRVVTVEPRTPLSSPESPMFRIIVNAASREYRVPAGAMILHRSSNDLRYLRRLGIDCYGISPYLVDAFQTATIHGVDEQIRLDRFERGVELTRKIVGRWAAGE